MKSNEKVLTKCERFHSDDSILHCISANVISLSKDVDFREYGYHLDIVVDCIRRKMLEDPLFNKLYQRVHHTGSYWDGLKVGKPEEFDVNFILKLPFKSQEYMVVDAAPAFVIVNVQQGVNRLKKRATWDKVRKIEKWLDEDNNLSAEAVRSWQESILEKALNALPNEDKVYCLQKSDGQCFNYKIVFKKSGPALTLIVRSMPSMLEFNVDIVPALEFPENLWPHSAKPCPEKAKNRSWHIVPKPYDAVNRKRINVEHRKKALCWRLSFHDQESALIHDSKHLKSTIKFLKKVRDVRGQHLLHSYALKTIFLWEIEKQDKTFWQKNLSTLFLTMMKKLKEYLTRGEIPFYWDKRYNLLDLTELQKENIERSISKAYHQILDGLQTGDKFVIARVLCTAEEFECVISKIKAVQ